MQDSLEYYLELSCHDFFVYLGHCSSEHSMSKGTRGKQLDLKMYIESTIIICQTSSSSVHLCITCTQVHSHLGDSSVLKSLGNS